MDFASGTDGVGSLTTSGNQWTIYRAVEPDGPTTTFPHGFPEFSKRSMCLIPLFSPPQLRMVIQTLWPLSYHFRCSWTSSASTKSGWGASSAQHQDNGPAPTPNTQLPSASVQWPRLQTLPRSSENARAAPQDIEVIAQNISRVQRRAQ